LQRHEAADSVRRNAKVAGLLAIAAGAIVAGAYVLDGKEDKRVGDVASTPKAAPVRQAAIPASHPALPPSHPPVAVAPPGAEARAGRVQVDPARPYTHFRVGNNSVIAIYGDGNVMWLGTSGGIVRFDTVTREFRKYDAHDGLRANGILYLGKLQGKISVGTYGGGLSLFDQDAPKWEHYGIAEGLGDTFVYDVLEASSRDVWVATGSGVNRVRGGALNDRANWDLYTVANTGGGLPNDRIYRLAEGQDGSIWLATRGGLANFQNGRWKNWIHAMGPGASYKEGSRESTPMSDASHSPSQRAGQTQGAQGGDAKADSNPNHIAALEIGEDGKVWAGTRGGGLARFDGNSWKNYTVAEGLPSNQVSTLNFDRNGRLWVGTRNGLAVFKAEKFEVLTMAHGLLAENVLSVATTKEGAVWVGGFGGVAHIQRPSIN
jgi:ligand-binding sensor domain-containing protein